MRIGELAARAGVTAKTVRYYEDIGLLPEPQRRANGYREYETDALDRLRFVRDAQAAGLSLAETGDILRMKDDGLGTCSHTRALIDRRLADIDRQIESLLAAKGELAALARRAETLDPADCTDANRCQVLSLDLSLDSKV
jgi:MerR family transcriptional regulator, copper efflux regulator